MIGDFLRKGLAWARAFFWISDSDAESGRAATPSGPAKSQRAAQKASAPKSTAQRRPAEAKTSTNKRATGSAKRTTAKTGGAKSSAPKSTAPKSTAPKSTGSKSTGPGAPEADPAKPGDLTEIKGVGPALKTKLAQLGIKSFADLAGADADQVAKSLNQRTITPDRVRSWIAEAKKRS